MMLYYIIVGFMALVSMAVSKKLKSKFATYSKLTLRNGMSGAEVAQRCWKTMALKM
jgi:Zn-dependent membrane protease YugP